MRWRWAPTSAVAPVRRTVRRGAARLPLAPFAALLFTFISLATLGFSGGRNPSATIKVRRYEAWGCGLFYHKQFAKENRNALEQKVVAMAVVVLDAIELELGC